MTGTAMTEASEFSQIYKLGVVPIPTNKPMVRDDAADVVYKTEPAKFDALVEDIAERHENGQPVLIGTTSVAKSEYLSNLLHKRGVKHEVLNAKQHDREATIIAQAGRLGAVTVATNMAGRGTDIMLGGNPDFLADLELRQQELSPLETPEAYESAWAAALEQKKKEVSEEHEKVVDAGGLYVLGTERHESRRIDNQLRGRSGRQGDPGLSRFYLSLGDDLMRLFNAAMVESIMNRLNIPDDVPIESKMVTRAIRSAQTQVEGQNFEIRKNVLKYDEVMNKQRTVIYAERRRVLEGEDLHEQIEHFLRDTITSYVEGATGEGYPEEWDLDQLWSALGTLYPVGVDVPPAGERDGLTSEGLLEDLIDDALEAYQRREDSLGVDENGTPVLRELERRVVLSVLDRKWREHLYEMDYLQEGIGLRAMGQRDPVVEYQREGFDMFASAMDGIKEESVGFLFNLEVQNEAPAPVAQPIENWAAGGDAAPEEPVEAELKPPSAPLAKGLEGNRPARLQYSAPAIDGDASGGPVAAEGPQTDLGDGVVDATGGEPSRNAPCPCGSGRKYKRCHGDPSRKKV
jgi:preprotein translocase subunit SecA